MNLSDWSPRAIPGQADLTGISVILEPIDWTRHLDGLYSAVASENNNDIWTYMPIGPFVDKAQFQSNFSAVSGHLGWQTLVIKNQKNQSVLGMSSFMRIREAHGSVEVGCVAFGQHLKRTKEATEAMYLMARHVFEDLGYRRYEWKCHNENTASKRAAERFGFQFEGIFRNDMVIDGKNRDTAWFSMTDGDWQQLKAAFEAWLAPENFDEIGQQKERLESFRSRQ